MIRNLLTLDISYVLLCFWWHECWHDLHINTTFHVPYMYSYFIIMTRRCWEVLIDTVRENFPNWQSGLGSSIWSCGPCIDVISEILLFFLILQIVYKNVRVLDCEAVYTISVGALHLWQFQLQCLHSGFEFASEQLCRMKGRRPSTRSTSSRTGLVDSPGRKMLSEVLLVCELLLFITLAALTGGNPPSTSTHGQKKRPQVRKLCFNSGARHF